MVRQAQMMKWQRGGMALITAILLILTGCTLNRNSDQVPTPIADTVQPTIAITADTMDTPVATPVQNQQAATGVPTPTAPSVSQNTQTLATLTSAPTLPSSVTTNGLPATPDPDQPGTFSLQTTFDSAEGGWIITGDETIGRGFENGTYYLAITSPGGTRWGYTLGPGGSMLRDTVMEAYVRLAQPGTNASYGLICRRTDDENYYYFLLNADGQAQIGRMQANERIPLTDWSPVPGLQPGDAFIHMQVGCMGPSLWLEVNGNIIARAEDTTHGVGSFGLFVVNNQAGEARADYDSLLVVGR